MTDLSSKAFSTRAVHAGERTTPGQPAPRYHLDRAERELYLRQHG